MEYILLILFFIILGVLALQKMGVFKSSPFFSEILPYTKKKYLLTQAELQFFKALQQAVGNQFYIFPQVRISDLLFIAAKGQKWWRYFRKINQKSADFVLCETHSLIPVLAIELNDSSHNREDRIERDEFLKRAFANAKLPILFVKCAHSYNPTELKNTILLQIDSDKIQVQN